MDVKRKSIYLWISMDAYGYLYIYGYPWMPMDIYIYPWISIDAYGYLYTYGYPWMSNRKSTKIENRSPYQRIHRDLSPYQPYEVRTRVHSDRLELPHQMSTIPFVGGIGRMTASPIV